MDWEAGMHTLIRRLIFFGSLSIVIAGCNMPLDFLATSTLVPSSTPLPTATDTQQPTATSTITPTATPVLTATPGPPPTPAPPLLWTRLR